MSEAQDDTHIELAALSEDFVAGAAAAIATAAISPVVGPFVSTAVKAFGGQVRKGVQNRASKRMLAFEKETFEALTISPEVAAEMLADDEDRQEVVFQNYRRAMDAIDEAVVPALGRLAAMYFERPPDPFFRAAGRLLQDMDGEELAALRVVLEAVVRANADFVSVAPAKRGENHELHCHPVDENTRPVEMDSLGVPLPPHGHVVLRLIMKSGLGYERPSWGADILVGGAVFFRGEDAVRLRKVIGGAEVDVFTIVEPSRPEHPAKQRHAARQKG